MPDVRENIEFTGRIPPPAASPTTDDGATATTLLTWSYYGERAITFIYDRVPGSTRRGEKLLHIVWRVVWCLVIYLGATLPSQLVWRFGDISNAAMALPNLLALALLSGVVFALARGDRTAGPDHRAATPEEPEEY